MSPSRAAQPMPTASYSALRASVPVSTEPPRRGMAWMVSIASSYVMPVGGGRVGEWVGVLWGALEGLLQERGWRGDAPSFSSALNSMEAMFTNLMAPRPPSWRLVGG